MAAGAPLKVLAIAVALLASACTSPAQGTPSGLAGFKATHTFDFPRLDAPGKPFPKVLIGVPDGWVSYKGFALRSPGVLTVSFWNVTDVYANSCHWLGPMIHPGQTVDGLAAVIAGRPLRNATAPVAVSLGGYAGKYLEWSVPLDASFSDCDQGPGDTFGWFESWTGVMLWNAPDNPSGTTDRYQQSPGQVDRLWILDVEGRRLVIDATYMPSSSTQDRALLQQVVDSIAFKP